MRIISEESNKKLKREYRLRFFILLCISILVSIILFISLISSSYLLLFLYEKIYVKEDSSVNSELVELHNTIEQKINDLYTLTKKIPSDSDRGESLTVIEKLLALSNGLVQIQSIEISDTNQITMRAAAYTRDSLIMFKEKVNLDNSFKNFSIPIETLARQKDINFTVTFTYDTH